MEISLFLCFIYGFIGGQWAGFANREQIRLHGYSWWRSPLVIVINVLFWPVCMVVAKIRRLI